jgi:hypothetical protein
MGKPCKNLYGFFILTKKNSTYLHYPYMLILTQGQTADRIIVTLNEKRTQSNPTYVFTATHVTTKEVVSFDLGTDLSNQTQRYNEFEINTSVRFLNKTTGQWQYSITQKSGGLEVEVGKLELNPSTDFEFSGYEPETTYNGYNG